MLRLLLRRRVHAHVRGAVGDSQVPARVRALLQEVQHLAARPKFLLEVFEDRNNPPH